MPANTAPERPSVPVGSERNERISFKGYLDDSELVASLTVVEDTTSDLTITGKAINSATMTVGQDEAVLAGQGGVCHVSGMTIANSPYTLNWVATTDASPDPQIIPCYTIFIVANK